MAGITSSLYKILFDTKDADAAKGRIKKAVGGLNNDPDLTIRPTVNDGLVKQGMQKLQGFLKSSFKQIGDSVKGASVLETLAGGEALSRAGEGLQSFAEKGAAAREALIQVRAQTGATAEEMQQIEASADRAFRQGVGENVAEATKAIGNARQQLKGFLDPNEIEAFTVQASAIGKTFDKDVNEVIGGSRTLIANFKLGGKEAGDLVSFAMQNAGSKMDDLLDTTDEYSQHAVEAGFSAQEFVGFLTTGIQAGVRDTDKLADAIKETKIRLNAGDISAGLASIQSPITASIQGIVKAGEQGKLSVKEVMQQSAQEIEKAFDAGQITEKTRAQLQTAISGSPAEDIGAELYGRIFSAPIDTAAISAKAAEVGEAVSKAGVPQTFWQGLKRDAEAAMVGISTTFGPVAEAAGGMLTTVGQIGPGLSLLQDKFKVFDIAGKAMGGLKDMAIKLVPSLFTQASATTAAAGAQGALNTAMSLNPAVKVALIIGALIGALVLLYQNSETVRNAIDGIWNVLKATGAFIGTFVSTYVKSLVSAFGGLGKVISGIFTLDFDQIKQGASEVTNAVQNATAGALKKATEAFKGSMSESEAAAKKAGTAGKGAGEGTAAAYDRATTSVKATAQAVVGLGQQFNEALNASKKAAEEAANEAAGIAAQLKNGKTLTPEERRALTEELKTKRQIREQREAEARDLLRIQKAEAADFDISVKQGKALIDIINDRVNRETTMLQRQTERTRLLAQEKVTNEDQLKIAQKRLDLLRAELTANGAKLKKEDLAKLNDAIDAAELETLKIKYEIVEDGKTLNRDIANFHKALQEKLNAGKKLDIELGIVAPLSPIEAIDAEIAELKKELETVNLTIKRDAAGNPIAITEAEQREALLKVQEITNQIKAQNVARKNEEAQIDKEIHALRLGLIADETERELEEARIRQQNELKYYLDAEKLGKQLTGQELDHKRLLEKKHQQELLAIRKKAYKEDQDLQLNMAKIAVGGLLESYKGLFEARKRMSDAEVNDKKLGFEKERDALNASLQRGEVSQREYNIKMAKLTEDRVNFEKEVEGSKMSRFGEITKNALGGILDQTQKYFEQLFQKYVFDEVMFAQMEANKTLAAEQGAEARAAASGGEVSGNLKSAGSSIVSAASSQIAKIISTLPFPVNFAAAAAGSLAITGLFSTLKKALGFATGGLAFVGERGPEIISPVKDFSHMIVTVAKQVGQSTREALEGQGGGGGFGRMEVDVTGTIKERGRDTEYRLERERLASRNEQLVTV
jgi:hypothetical protein